MRFLFAFSIILTAAVPALAQMPPPQPASMALPIATGDELLLVRPQAAGATIVHHTDRHLVFTAGANRVAIDFDGRLVAWRHDRRQTHLALLAQTDAGRDSHPLQLALYSSEGQRRFRMPLDWQKDEPLPELAVNRRGEVAIGEAALGIVRFLDSQGREMAQQQLIDERRYELEKVLLLEFLPDGDHLVVATMANAAAPGMASPRQNAYLVLFTVDGRELWRQVLPEPSIYNLAASADGNFILVAGYDAVSSDDIQRATRVFSRDGRQVLEAEHLFRHASFAAGNGLAVLAEKTEARVYDLAAGERRGHYRTPDPAQVIVAVALDSAGSATAVLSAENVFESDRFRFVAPRLQVFDAGGTLLSDYEVAAPLRAPYLLPAGDRHLAMLTENTLELLPWRAP